VASIRRAGTAAIAILRASDGRQQRLSVTDVLVATGRRPFTARLGLDAVGVKVGDRGQVVVDRYLRTSNPRIWAAGDVTGAPQYVYVAAGHGTLAAGTMFAEPQAADYRHLPRVTFTSPAVAAAGLTQAQAVADGLDVDTRLLALEHVPRAVVDRDTRGLAKLVADRDTGRLLGVTAVAHGAGEIIGAAGYALAGGMTVAQVAAAWCPYLTMTEALKLAAQTFARDVTKLSCCAT
jgi:mercuric reductase